jgi:DNA repair exonuclease SbcCD ATPase subunit
MSRVYESLKVVVQDTLQLGKAAGPLARVKGDSAATLNEELEEIERIIADRIGRLKTVVQEGEAVVAGEAQRAEQLIEGLRENIAALETKQKEMDDAARGKDAASRKLEESLTAKIQSLQSDVKKKEEALESRASEINDFKSKLDGQVKQMAQLESSIQKAKAETANHTKRTEELSESSRVKIAALQAQLRDTEEIVRKKDSVIKGLEQNLVARVQEFEGRVRDKEELLASRRAEISDLKSQLKLLTRGIKEMSSFFKQAEVFSAVEGQAAAAVVLEKVPNGGEQKPPVAQTKAGTSHPPDVAREIVSPDLFQRMTGELTKVMGPMASMIVRDHVVALGESMEKFPKTRFTELVKGLSEEIGDEKLRVGFRERVVANL